MSDQIPTNKRDYVNKRPLLVKQKQIRVLLDKARIGARDVARPVVSKAKAGSRVVAGKMLNATKVGAQKTAGSIERFLVATKNKITSSSAWQNPNNRVTVFLIRLIRRIRGILVRLFSYVKLVMARIKRKRAASRRKLTPNQRLKKSLRFIKSIRFLAILFFTTVIAGVIGFFVLFAWYSRELPKVGNVQRYAGYSTKIFDRNGKLLYDMSPGDERRNSVTADQLPQHLKNAVIATEDKTFYQNEQGYDITFFLKTIYYYIKDRRLVGGSTITQQLVKNALLTNERSVSRKFKEWVLATQVARKYTKDEILTMYLNEAPYGGTAYGVATAAELYFDKEVKDLSVLEAAVLAGLPQSPSRYSPIIGKRSEDGELFWKIRTNGVLMRMLEENYISNEEYNQLLTELKDLEINKKGIEINAPHFVFFVKQQLIEMFGEELVELGGIKVTTSLDLELQNEVEELVKSEIDRVKNYNITNGAVMAMDPQNGEILVMIGSRDYFDEEIDGKFNVAVDGLRQPGSSIKPVTYLTMIRQGYTPASVIVDVPTTFLRSEYDAPYNPKNYDGSFRGAVNIRNSLGSSLNIPAVKALATVGIDNFLQQAYEMGFKTLAPTAENKQRFGLAVTLGGAEIHMIDQITAYSSFANGGLKIEPLSILKVEDQNGHTLFERQEVQKQRIFSEGEAFLINHILSDNNARLLAFNPHSLLNTGRDIAVKTGTTNEEKDNWAVGWSRTFIVSAWVGNNDNTKMRGAVSGVSGASPIWRKTVNLLIANEFEVPDWEIPDSVEEVEVDQISGYLAHDEFPSKIEYVIKGTLPTEPDPIHKMIYVCKGKEDQLATEAKIAGRRAVEREFIVLKENDPYMVDGENLWQQGIDEWINGQGDTRYKVPTEYCGDSGDVYVSVRNPDNKETYDDTDIKVEVVAGSDDGIEWIEIWIDDELHEKVDDYEYDETVHISSGRHEIYAKAKSRSGKTKKSSTKRFGTGGVNWEEPSPTPEPEPTDVPEPSNTPAPAPSP